MENQRRIKVLPAEVVDQIKAGEIVERPASVLKELIENSIDSGATRIDVAIDGAGEKLISVKDNGCGMSREDVCTCLKQHATSKLARVQDLDEIHTLGFRGEAIPSIASSSRMRIVTAPENEPGTEVVVRYGGEPTVTPYGMPRGTLVEVRDLFRNMPARRAFLKSPQAEMGHVFKTFVAHAFAHPEIGFKLNVAGGRSFSLLPDSTLRERIGAFYGSELADSLVPFEHSVGDVSVHGFLQLPSGFSAFHQEQFFFVNGRPASEPIIHCALKDALACSQGDARPFVVLFVEVPTCQVNVNVHPAKREVRFLHRDYVRNVIVQAIKQALTAATEGARPAEGACLQGGGEASEGGSVLDGAFGGAPTAQTDALALGDMQMPLPIPMGNGAVGECAAVPLKVVGCSAGGYVVAESEKGIVLVDAAAAQERVICDGMEKEGKGDAQQLLLPEIVSLDPISSAALEVSLEDVRLLGFDVDELSAGTWKVNAIPASVEKYVNGVKVEDMLRDITQGMAEGSGRRSGRALRELVARGVARNCAAVGSYLTPEVAHGLLARLAQTAEPYRRPVDSTPTMVYLSYPEIKRRLGR